MIQERRWWEVGRFSQLGLQWCVVAGSHTHESPCGSGQGLLQQLAKMWSWAWAAQMHTDASGSPLKSSTAGSWGEMATCQDQVPMRVTSSFLPTSKSWLRHLCTASPHLTFLPALGILCIFQSLNQNLPPLGSLPSCFHELPQLQNE